MGTSSMWSDVAEGAVTQAGQWLSSISPLITAFVALGVLALAVTLIRRAGS